MDADATAIACHTQAHDGHVLLGMPREILALGCAAPSVFDRVSSAEPVAIKHDARPASRFDEAADVGLGKGSDA